MIMIMVITMMCTFDSWLVTRPGSSHPRTSSTSSFEVLLTIAQLN